MNRKLAITYIDRTDGTAKAEYPFASGFLYWSYNTILGRSLTIFILSRKIVSQLYGWLARRKFSRHFILAFIRRANINWQAPVQPIKDFSCFNNFFIREPKNDARSVNKETNSLIAPADGKLLVYTGIGPNNTFLIKRNIFNLRQFLCNDNLASKLFGGTMLVLRLCLSDYHQFYFPDSGLPLQLSEINFGQIVMAEVGAFTVGSIRQTFIPGKKVNKGDKKGRFELGGSTVVLLFTKDSIIVDDDLFFNSIKGFETKVCYGEKIAVSKISCQTNKKVAV